ncbi:antitoxin MazE-like protein [Nitrospirillum sp. BR 11164]|uniref:antitoxin MazE-like protein n=1 Tax=Nitrospirillum sp. BR 11164 TaxID=3104324 RepID=UPI002AFE1735|nr:antitoxin MazE-like protein [Nitrospirillum sp. BR 11164]MEA1652109.1 antitoxin MazE-like protein [Nitrospirillum sp. BR 11164]
MTQTAARVRAFRERRKALGLREVRIFIPNARSTTVQARIAAQAARLDHADEQAAMDWVEAVSEFDNEDPDDAAR